MKAIKFVLPLLLLLALAGIGYAETFNTPASSATITGGTYVVNLSLTTQPNLTANCTLTFSSVLTSDTAIYVARNQSGANGQFANVTIDTFARKDASDWTFGSGTCYNSTMQTVATITAVTGVVINNTVPILTVNTPTAAQSITDNTMTWNATTVNGTSSATLTYNGLAYTMTKLSGGVNLTTYTHTLNTLKGGTYTWSVAASDGLDSTTSTSTLKVSVSRSRALSGTQDTSVPTTAPTGGLLGMSTTTVIIVAVVLYFLFKKPGGKGKRKR